MYADIVVEYNKAIETDLLNIANNRNRISREIEENQMYLNEVKKLEFSNPSGSMSIIKNLITAAKYFKKYKKLKAESEKLVEFKSVFDNTVLSQKPKLSVEYEEYIDNICAKIKEVPTAEVSVQMEGVVMDEKKIFPDDKIKRMPQSRKIIIPRWCTRMMAEYEIDNNFWMSNEIKSDTIFYPFSGFVYLNNKTIYVIGGLNDNVKISKHSNPKKNISEGSEDAPNTLKTFSSKVLRINCKSVNFIETKYDIIEMQPMKTKRGCMAACYNQNNKIYV